VPWSDWEHLPPPLRDEDALARWVAAYQARIADIGPRGRGYADEVAELRERVDQPCADLFDMRIAGGRAGVVPVYVKRGRRGWSPLNPLTAVARALEKDHTPSLAALRVGQTVRLRSGRQRVEDDYAVVVNGFTTEARGTRSYACGVVSYYAKERKAQPFIGQVHLTKKMRAKLAYETRKRNRRRARARKTYVAICERW
jgi:hypothetical protein